MEIILNELEQFTTEKINDIDIYNQYDLDFINKKFLNIIYDNKQNNIKYIQLFEYDQGKVKNIICEKKTNPDVLYKTYLFEHDFNFDTIFTIIKNIQNNQLTNSSNRFRKIGMVDNGTIVTLINLYQEINNDDYKYYYDKRYIKTIYI